MFLIFCAVVIAAGCVGTAKAEVSSSAHYKMTETDFNAGTTLQSCSTQYCAKSSAGGALNGDTAGASSAAKVGSVIDGDPLLEVLVNSGTSDVGTLTTEHTTTKTMTVQVRTYLSNGYSLQIVGDPPKFGTHTLTTLPTPTASRSGVEQFGINVVANTSPAIGTNPVQVPSDQTSFGVANDDYKTPNLFKYINGDVVAHSQSQSGRTDYTISMVMNISNGTPAGHYSGDFSAIVVPVY